LKSIKLVSFKTITDAAIMELVSSCTKLEKLTLDYTNITENSIIAIKEDAGPRLKQLSLRGCSRIGSRCLIEMFEKTINIKKLDLTCFSDLKKAVIIPLSVHCKRLNKLTLTKALINDYSLFLIIRELSSLEELKINDARKVTSYPLFMSLIKHTAFKSLTEDNYRDLKLLIKLQKSSNSYSLKTEEDCKEISIEDLEIDMEFYQTTCLSQLKVLYLNECSICDGGVWFISTFCRSLKKLILNFNMQITTESIQHISTNAKRLKFLSLNGVRGISNETVRNIKSTGTNKKFIVCSDRYEI